MRAFLIPLLLVACAPEPMVYAGPGDPSYKTAALCTTADLAPFVRDAAQRWHDADPEVSQAIRVMAAPQNETEGCDANVYVDAGVRRVTGDEGITRPGLIILDGSDEFMSDASDVVAHELGHLLIGMGDEAHSADPASVMFGREQAGEQDVLVTDVAKIGSFAR